MDLRRKIKYQWQLFIPLVLTIWVIIIGMAVFSYSNEKHYREAQVIDQLSLVQKRIIALAEDNSNPKQFLDFIVRYYKDNPLYDVIRITLYQDGEMIRSYGQPIPRTFDKEGLYLSEGTDEDGNKLLEEQKYFYSKKMVSDDGTFEVYTILPFNRDVIKAILPSNKMFWFMTVLAVVMTIVSFYSTRYFGRNISILRSIAREAANDPNFIPPMNYPHDELGDITRQIVHIYNKRLEAMELQKREHAVALNAIEEKAKAKRQLTNNINHELRTPIGVIKGYLDTILDNPDMDEGARTHFMRKAQEHVNRLVDLIADVSAITRLEEGGELINTEELDFHDLVFTTASDLQASGALGAMRFDFDLPLNCIIDGNYNLLTGMLINLAKNAASYSKGTKCELKYLSEDDDYYSFVFQDDGTGVSEEHMPHLFERFYRIDSGRSRKAGGSGLGLPIVQTTVKAHGGTIEVRNGELGGLAFYFTIPKHKTDKA